MREIVDNLKHMMNVTDEDLQQFREQSSDTMLEVKEDSTSQALFDEYMKNVQQKEDL